MKPQNQMKRIGFILGLLLVFDINFNIFPSIAKERCGDTQSVKPSKTTKTLELKKFGIKIKVPSNYRTMLRNDGSVTILDPGAYEAVICAAPHGIYSFAIKLISNPKNLSLVELAKYSYTSSVGERMKLHNYNFKNTPAILIDSEGGYGAYGIFKVPGIQGIVEMSASCDCEVNKTDIIGYLKFTEIIN